MTKNRKDVLSTMNTRSEEEKKEIFNLLEDIRITSLIENGKMEEVSTMEKQTKKSEAVVKVMNVEYLSSLVDSALLELGITKKDSTPLENKVQNNGDMDKQFSCFSDVSADSLESINNMERSKEELIAILTGTRLSDDYSLEEIRQAHNDLFPLFLAKNDVFIVADPNKERLSTNDKNKRRYGWENYKNQTKINN